MSVFDYARRAGNFIVDTVKADIQHPANLLVPGGENTMSAVQSAATATGQGLKSAGEGVGKAAGAAGAGVKTGFEIGILILVLGVGLYIWAILRPPR